MDASTRPETANDDQLRNLSASEAAQRAIASLNRANEIVAGVQSADPLADFDKENATRGEVEDKLQNLSAMMQVIRQAKPDCNTWNTAEWDIDLAMQVLKREIELRDTIDRDRKRGFRVHPLLHRIQMDEAMAWGIETFGLKGKAKTDAHTREESRDERRLREANPNLPVIKSPQQLFIEFGMPIAEREVRLFKADPREAQSKAFTDIGKLLTEDEQELLLDIGVRLHTEEEKKEANREKVRKHREKYGLTGDYIYRDAFPEDWSDADILRYLSPPNSTEAKPELTREEARREKDRLRKQSARAAAKRPAEGSNEEAEPQLAPLAYRQKMAAIKAKLSHAMPPYWWLEQFDTLFDVMWEGCNTSATDDIERAVEDWKAGVYEDEGGPKAPEPTPEQVEEWAQEKAASDERYRRYKADKVALAAGHELPDHDNQLSFAF